MRTVGIDFETYCDLDIKKVGSSRYTRHPSAEVLMVSWAADDEPVKGWTNADGTPFPQELLDLVADPSVQKRAFNANFEIQVFRNILGVEIDLDQWICVMALANSLALPGKLSKLGSVLGLAEDKQKDSRGTALIRTFCVPRKPTKTKAWTRATAKTDPDKWEEFRQYNLQDVVTEREAFRLLQKFDIPEWRWQSWRLDQIINERGVPLNVNAVKNAVQIVENVKGEMVARMAELTGLSNPNSPKQLLPWLRANGYQFADLKKGHVERERDRAAAENADSDLYEILDLRSQISRTSVTKFSKMLEMVDDDGRLRNQFLFSGAGRTNRFSGKGVQLQNLPRPAKAYEPVQVEVARRLDLWTPEQFAFFEERPFDALSAAVRPVIQAPEGYTFIDCDFSAIEAVVLGALMGDEVTLETFRSGKDPYLTFAAAMAGTTYEEEYAKYKAGDKKARTEAKPGELGCGYALSAGKFVEDERTGEMVGTGLLGYAQAMGIELSPEMAKKSVKTWRELHKTTVKGWYELFDAFKTTVKTGKPAKFRDVSFRRHGPFVQMILPSGRPLSYCRPRIRDVEREFEKECPLTGKITKTKRIVEELSYESQEKGMWRRVSTHVGKAAENITQATALDLLDYAMKLVEAKGIEIVMHVHDQIVCLVKEEDADWALKEVLKIMSQMPDFAADWPVKAAGHISKHFLKD